MLQTTPKAQNSTADDYLRFEQCWLTVGYSVIDYQVENNSHDGQRQTNGLYQGISQRVEGQGFGYTVAVSEDPILGNQRRSQGALAGAALGYSLLLDPEEQLTAVLMLQQPFRPAQNDFENAVGQP